MKTREVLTIGLISIAISLLAVAEGLSLGLFVSAETVQHGLLFKE